MNDRTITKQIIALFLSALSALTACASPTVPPGRATATLTAGDTSNGANNFYASDKVIVRKVTFKNQYTMNVAGNLFFPKNLNRDATTSAIVVGHPMGAVKEQSANLYATKLAEQGFVTLSLDLSFWGESEGKPGHLVSPEIYSDDFSAAVDEHRPCSTRVLRLLPHLQRCIHAEGGGVGADDEAHAQQHRQVPELLPAQRHRDDLASAHALHHGRQSSFQRVQRRCLSARR
jgi:hypothetical protein